MDPSAWDPDLRLVCFEKNRRIIVAFCRTKEAELINYNQIPFEDNNLIANLEIRITVMMNEED